MGFGIRIGPFWWSLSSGRKRKRTSTRCQRCFFRTRLRGKVLCEVCDYEVRQLMDKHTDEAWAAYLRSKESQDPNERVELLKDAIRHFKVVLRQGVYGYTMQLRGKPVAIWKRDLKRELREAKRARKQAQQA